jgi:hypothetical protein
MRTGALYSARLLSTLTLLSRRAVFALPSLAAAVVDEEPDQPIGSAEFWVKMGVAAGLVLLGGVFAGLTLGLMGLDELHLRVLASSSDNPKEQKNAEKGKLCSSTFEEILMTGSAAFVGEETSLGPCGESRFL